jgi:hypothetical protein
MAKALPTTSPASRRLTAEDRAAFDETTRLLEERIAYHQRMSELLGERERDRIAELERRQRAS